MTCVHSSGPGAAGEGGITALLNLFDQIHFPVPPLHLPCAEAQEQGHAKHSRCDKKCQTQTAGRHHGHLIHIVR